MKEHSESSQSRFLRPATGLPSGHEDGLKPLYPLDLSMVNSFSDMAYALAETPFAGREVGQAVDTLTKMAKDPDAFVVMTVSGAMTPAKMGLIIADMIDRGMVQAIVSTGALMAHGFVESVGRNHFWAEEGIPDTEWFVRGYNRIHRALEPERNLDEVEEIFNHVMSTVDTNSVLSSREITHLLGAYLGKSVEGRGILKSAYQRGVPVFIPAFTDSELGLDMGLFNLARVEEGLKPINFNPFKDLDFYAELIRSQSGKKLGIFTVGGGVPRNWAQQIGPYLDLQEKRMKKRNPDHQLSNPVMFHYALRICPDDVGWGGLSGCTYEEGKSWGKFWPDAVTTEVKQDATVVWPFIAKATFERLGDKPIRKNVYAGPEAVKEIANLIDQRYQI